MLLIVGLGNKGLGYKKTFHNVGFMAVDKLAQLLNMKFNNKAGFAKIAVDKQKGIVLAKPQTYMNLSGKSVSELARLYKINTEDIIILYDDIDLKKGKIRTRDTGSGGTHNGMKNIIAVMNTKDIKRVRIGIDKDKTIPLKDYVLSRMNATDKDLIMPAINNGMAALVEYIHDKDFEKLKRVTN